MIEIAHDDLETLVFFAQKMVDGDLDVVKLDISRGSSCGVTCLDSCQTDSSLRMIKEQLTLIFLVSTLSSRGTKITLNPLPVLQPTTK